MIDDDDALDPVIADRFRRLDAVDVPDTWTPDMGPLAGRRRPAWMIGAAAAAVIALVTGFVLVRSGDDAGDLATVDATTVAPPGTTTAPAVVPTTTASTTPDGLPNALATADPSVVVRRSLITITPSSTIERNCTDIVDVLLVGDGPVIGQVLSGSTWQPVPDGAPGPTWPACGGTITDAPLSLTVPDVPDGSYRFCIAAGELPEGCALVTVVGDGPASGIATEGSAEPAVVVPGQLVTITPTEEVRRACTGLVGVYDAAGTYRGHVGGTRFSPSPGEGDTAPACEGDVSEEPIQVNAPDLPSGTYVLCVSEDVLPDGCATVVLQASPLLAAASPADVATGDAITITPAGVVPRLCGGVTVRIFDVMRSTPVLHVIDPATGASELPPFGGGWESPDCIPEPSDASLAMVVPDLPLGAYAFCLSVDPTDAACALVFVTSQRIVQPSVPPGSTAPPVSTGAPGFVSIEPGTPLVVDVITHCGFEYLVPEIDGRLWMTDEAAGTFEWGPPEWVAVSDEVRELIELELVLSEDRNVLTATANGRSVVYRPVTPEDVQFRCA